MTTQRRRRRLILLLLVLASIPVLALATRYSISDAVTSSVRTTPTYDPPVLAGQMAWGYCGGGVYARRDETIVLTSSGHCAPEGTTAYDPDGVGVAGVWGPISHAASCAHAGYRCTASDMNHLIVAADRIPWGHLNEIDMGAGGYRVIAPGIKPLECDDVQVNDPVEIGARGVYRTGRVLQKGEYLKPAILDSVYFPCIILADVHVATGDSGGAVLVRGVPAGIASRRFGYQLGFTPLGAGLAELGLTMCDTPNCGLTPP